MPGRSRRGEIAPETIERIETIVTSFLPFFPLVEREALSDASGSSVYPAHGDRAGAIKCDPAATFDALSTLARTILIRLIAGPVPLPLVITAARRSGFHGTALIELAAAIAGSSGGGGTLIGAGSHTRGFDGLGLFVRGMTDEGTGAAEGSPEQEWFPPALMKDDEDLLAASFSCLFETLGEERPGQFEMARVVADVLGGEGIALIEAGTGIGKSLAYLVPSLLHSLKTDERVIVSTHTKNLQDQLVRREMPLLESILNCRIRTARLMGRENYLCARKVVSLVSRLLDDGPERALTLMLSAALTGEGTVGSLAEIPSGITRGSLAAPRRCSPGTCSCADGCALIAARKRARETRILFVNHALLMTDYRQGRSIIGPYRRVIFDEAHNLERCIMENLSLGAGRDDVERIIEPLRPVSKGDGRWKLLAAELEAGGTKIDLGRLVKDIAQAAHELGESYQKLFSTLTSSLNEFETFKRTRTRYTDGGEVYADAQHMFKDIYLIINKLRDLLKLLLEEEAPQSIVSFQQEIAAASDELRELFEVLSFLREAQDEEFVFWLEWDGNGALSKMCGSPLKVDRLFADYIEDTCGSAVFTSATLAQGGSFEYTVDRLGLALAGLKRSGLVAPSPFDYDENCLILLATYPGDPNDEGFGDEVGDIVARLAGEVTRRTMVLFTSYRLCLATSRFLDGRDIPGPVLIQDYGESREALSEQFRSSRSGVLLGVASFWEGVDFPGEELEILVIPKIPFPVPTEPIVEARSERIQALGGNPFESLFVPEAVMRLRQGVGRLIRRKQDRGVVVILDSRLDSKRYGETVLASLPSRAVRVRSTEEMVSRSLEWLKESD